MTRVTRSSKLARSTRIETRSASAIIRRRRFGFSAAQVKRNCSSARLTRPAVGELLDEAVALFESQRPPGERRPVALLVLVEELRVDPLPLARDHPEAALDVGRDRDEPRRRRQLAPRTALHAAPRRRDHAGALAVEVGVEERVERHDPVGVGRTLIHEVDDDAGLLARMDSHDPADPLLVDAAARRRREVHDDGRSRRVPALGEQHRVDQDVDLAPLVGGEGLGELDGRRRAGDGLRLEAGRAELLGEVVRVVDAGGVDDARACRRSDRGRGSRPPGSAPGGRAPRPARCWSKSPPTIGTELIAATGGTRRQRSEAISPRRAASCKRQVVDRGGEDVRDLLRDQLLGRGHPDVEGSGSCGSRRSSSRRAPCAPRRRSRAGRRRGADRRRGARTRRRSGS